MIGHYREEEFVGHWQRKVAGLQLIVGFKVIIGT
jgi:hypothetical protein